MNVVKIGKNELNGVLGDLIGSILQPSAPDQTNQLTSELYYNQQKLESAKTTNTYLMIATGVFGITTAFLGYKHFKK